jgi:hypothetical protein
MSTRYSLVFVLGALPYGCDGEGGNDPGPGDGNSAPVADAGEDVSVPAATIVQIDGCGSYDPDADSLTFEWSLDHVPDGSALAGAVGDEPTINPFPDNYTATCNTSLQPDLMGTYVVKLQVTDGKLATSQPDYAVITVGAGEKPIADAGPDQTYIIGSPSPVELDGSGSSDPANLPLDYGWAFTTKPAGSTRGPQPDAADTVRPTFTPDVPGLYTIALVVDNGTMVSDPDSVNVMVSVSSPNAPVANAGADVTAEDCTTIQLNGSDSTSAKGTNLTYSWALQSKPAISTATNANIADRTAEITTFFADVGGTYVLSLAVFDGTSWSIPDTVTINTIERLTNVPPAVFAGKDLSFSAGTAGCDKTAYGWDCDECAPLDEIIGIDASITDKDGDPYTHLWEVVSGQATIDEPTELVTAVTLDGAAPVAEKECAESFYTFRLNATDCPEDSSSDEVEVSVICCGI